MASSTPQSHRATVIIAASEIDANLYYATKFIAPDPFIYLEIKGERMLVMSDLEMDRAKSQSSVDRVLSYSEVEGRAKTQGIAEPSMVEVVHILLREGPGELSLQPCRQVPVLGVPTASEKGPVLRTACGEDCRRSPLYRSSPTCD